MKRREFITLLGGVAAGWPIAARAQQPGMPVVGFLRSVSLADAADLVTAFRQGLKETGYIEGQNVAIELRSAEGHLDRLPALVADLDPPAGGRDRRQSKSGGRGQGRNYDDADRLRDRERPGQGRPRRQPQPAGWQRHGRGLFASGLGAKRLELLRQLVPKATTIAMLVNPSSPDTEAERRDVQAAAQAIGQQLIILDASSDRDIETAFATFVQRGAGALLVGAGAFMFSNRERLVALAARHALPAIYADREDAVAGGLMSYGPALWMPIGKPASTPGGFSRARSRPICRSCSPPNSSL